MIKLIGFAPDLPPETPGIMTDCDNLLPSINTFEAAQGKISAGMDALPSAAVGFSVITKNDGTRRTFAGTASTLYEAATSAWNDVSKSGGYTLGVDDRWRFAQFGNTTIATSKSSTIQSSTTGAFADIGAAAPKADIVETINNQVFAFNTVDPSFGTSPDRWWCSALGDETDWTPAVATQCVSGRLMSSPGAITAARTLGGVIVAYKADSMYVGQYVGAPNVWDWQQVPGAVGTPCQEAIVNIGAEHVFIGNDDFYVFDGSRPIPMESPLRQWFFRTLDASFAYKISAAYDRVNKRVFWWFPTNTSNGVLSACVVYNVKTRQWGRMDGPIEIAAEYVSQGVSIDGLDSLYPTIADLPTNISFDSPYWLAGGRVLAAFGTDHKAYTYSGDHLPSRFTTGHHGENTVYSTCSLVKPRFIQSPGTSQLIYSYSETDAANFTQNLTVPYEYGWYDVLWSAIWHKFEFQFTGNVSISGYDVTLTQEGVQ